MAHIHVHTVILNNIFDNTFLCRVSNYGIDSKSNDHPQLVLCGLQPMRNQPVRSVTVSERRTQRKKYKLINALLEWVTLRFFVKFTCIAL